MAQKQPAIPSEALDSRRVRAAVEDIVGFALSLPQAVESTAYGQPAVKRGARLLFTLRKDLETLALVCGFEERAELMRAHPEAFFITDHYLNYPSVVVRLSHVKKTVLRRAVEAACRRLGTLDEKKPRRAAKPKTSKS